MEFKSEIKQCGCKKHEPCTCEMHEDVCKIGEMPKHMFKHEVVKREHEKERCPEKVKGFNLCRRRNELRCFKHCEPIAQPCGSGPFNYFTNRTNFEFSGLVVVTNTGNPSSGCAMTVVVIDRAGTSAGVVINPGASVPFFVEGLMAVNITCAATTGTTLPPVCSGEIIFDLEYCASQVCF